MLHRVPFESAYVSKADAAHAAQMFQEMADELLIRHVPTPTIAVVEEQYLDGNHIYDDVLLQREMALRFPGAIRMSAILLYTTSIYEPDKAEYSLSLCWKLPRHLGPEHRICDYSFYDDEAFVERIDWDSELLPPDIPRYLNSPERDAAIESQVVANQNGLCVGSEDIARLRQTLSRGRIARLG